MEQAIQIKGKFFTVPKTILLVCSIIVLLFLAFLSFYHLELIAFSLVPLLLFSLLILIAIWTVIIIRLLIKKLVLKTVLSLITIVCTIALVVGIIPYIMLFSSIDGKVSYRSISPSGKNSLIVFEGGFFDTCYSAYPVELSFFYKYQDNGFVSKHDSWGGAINVDWISEKEAHVKIDAGNFLPHEGSNKDDIIIVTFD